MANALAPNSLPWMLRALALALGALVVPPANADRCVSVNRDTADRAVAMLDDAEQVLVESWFDPLRVQSVRWVRAGFLYRVEINGTRVVDLSAVYVPRADGAGYDNLGARLGCPLGGAPERVPRSAFSEEPVPAYAADEDAWPPPRALQGLLALPELERAWYQGTEGADAVPVAVHAQPSREAPVRRHIAAMTDVPYLEYGYERPGAIVLERRTGWYRVALPSGDGWLAADDAGEFHGVASLVSENLAYLTTAWDGRLYTASASSSGSRWLHPLWRRHIGGEVPVSVAETRESEGTLWLRVEIAWPSPCSGDEPSVLASGWVPAHTADHEMNVWYYSRGC